MSTMPRFRLPPPRRLQPRWGTFACRPAAGERRGSRRGFAVLAVLWVVILAGLILLGVQRGAWTCSVLSRNRLAQTQARWLARAGIEQALAALEDDAPEVDGPDESWYQDEELFQNVPLTGGAFWVTAPNRDRAARSGVRYGLIDHAGRVNVNVADANQLANLPPLDPAAAEAIRDWVEKGDVARPGGAKAGYYLHLRFPYNIRNGPMQTPAELLLVKGVTEEMYFGPGGRAAKALETPPLEGAKPLEVPPALEELATVYSYEMNATGGGQDRVNVSTADRNALIERLNLSSALADGLIRQRGGRQFDSLMALLDVRPGTAQRSTGAGQDSSSGKTTEINLRWIADHLDEMTLTDDKRLPARINVNTADRESLLSLPAMTDAAADAIVARRSSNSGPFRGVGDLLGGALNEDQFKALAERCTVRSNVFEVRSTGVATWGARHEIVAVVDRSAKPMAILYWCESE